MKKYEKRFCGRCGAELVLKIVRAEKYCDPIFKDCYEPYPNPNFDLKTGRKLFVRRMICPRVNWLENFISFFRSVKNHDHDDVSVGSEKPFTKEFNF